MSEDDFSGKIRPPAVAGQFYTGNPAALRREVESYINSAEYFPGCEPIALVSPHAGYMFSGAVAGCGFRQVEGRRYDAVVVISPSHMDYFSFSAVMESGAYRTPLGDIPIQAELAKEISEYSPLIRLSDRGHSSSSRAGRGEHALEVQLPFLQVALGDFKLVPIIMGDQKWEQCLALGEALAAALQGKKALIVASSDLSHFHPYDEANRLDSAFIELVEAFDPRRLCDELQSKKVEACGGGPIAAAMVAAKKLGATGVKSLKHANSGDVPVAGKESVVGYLSAMFCRSQANDIEEMEESAKAVSELLENGPLTMVEKRQLMEIAKATIDAVVRGNPVPEFEPVSSTVREERGAFVTIRQRGQLRGCIGYIIPVKPLYLTVREVAESAALKDPRFPPVSIDELPYLEYEISALSPIRKIEDVKEIEVGRDGIIIRRGYYQGLLLPQVATEYGWNREQFLEHTCKKAGLPANAWKNPDTEISIFSAEVFDENDVK